MANTIDQAFITQFESEVHLAYQRMGSKLKNTVRNSNNVIGSVVRFQKLGVGSASTKARNADVSVMNPVHSYVEATLTDHYAAEYVDKLDELKTNIDERGVLSTTAAAALGRKTDEIIITEAENAAAAIGTNADGLTLAKCQAIFETFEEADVMGESRWVIISPAAWTDLLNISEFANMDYLGPDELPYKSGATAKRWLGFTWMTHSGLSNPATTERTCLAYEQNALGLGVGQEISTEINYVPEKVAHLVTSCMSMGAKIIQSNGVYTVPVLE